MASVLFVSWVGGGNVNPMVCLARGLADRGAEVAVLGGPGLRAGLGEVGLRVLPEASGWLPCGEDVLRALEDCGAGGLVVDYMLTDALGGAEASGLPTVALVHTLYKALLVNGAPHPMGMAGPIETLNATRVKLGLRPIHSQGDLLQTCALVAVAAPRELDAPGPVPANVAYLGALIPRPVSPMRWDPPPGTDPLVAVSLGTTATAGNEAEILQRILVALGRLPVRGLVNLADYISPDVLKAPGNVTLAGYIPHQVVLPHTSVLVTHAGLGSVIAALSCGVPMVCMPLGREQPENAAAVARIGRGVALAPAAETGQIAEAISDMLALGRGEPIASDPASAARAVMKALVTP